MFWTILSVLVCIGLIVKVIFFSDDERSQSNLFYRVALFFVAIYAFSQVIGVLYHPDLQSSPISALIHLAMFVAAFWLRAEHFLTRKQKEIKKGSINESQ